MKDIPPVPSLPTVLTLNPGKCRRLPFSSQRVPAELSVTHTQPRFSSAAWWKAFSMDFPTVDSCVLVVKKCPSHVCGSLLSIIVEATTVRWICVVHPPIVNIRTSRTMRFNEKFLEYLAEPNYFSASFVILIAISETNISSKTLFFVKSSFCTSLLLF